MKKQLSEIVARRMLYEMEQHGGVDDFCEKLTNFPEKYLTVLADAAMECFETQT